MDEVIKFINNYIETFGRYPKMSGGCYKFHLTLKLIFPTAEGYYNSDHIITKIGDNYYDIDGYAIKTDKFLHFDEFGEELIKKQFKNTYERHCKVKRKRPCKTRAKGKDNFSGNN